MSIENVCRINVWPTMAAARAAFDGADGSELCGRMIVWPTTKLAKEYYAENAGEGGGGTPAWVPSGAKIHIDFLGGTPQGRAWVDGTGEVALTSILGADAVFVGSGYNPANIISDGYVVGNGTVAFLGTALARIISDFTFRIAIKDITNDTSSTILDLRPTDRADYIRCYFDFTPGTLTGESASDLFETIPGLLVKPPGSINVVALTITGTRYEMAGNGSAPVAATLTVDDRPAGNPFAHAMTGPSGYAIQSITIYDPLPTTAGLSALSEIS